MRHQPAPALPIPRRDGPAPHVIVVGGGASGVLMAANLMERGPANLTVTLIERRQVLGCGLAYSTEDPQHLLNTRSLSMSAFPDRPHHFEQWLAAAPDRGEADPQAFASRMVYGRYLSDLIRPWTIGSGGSGGPEATAGTGGKPRRLTCVSGNCLRVEETATGGVAHLEDGSRIAGTVAVLATGHVLPRRAEGDPAHDPWVPAAPPADPGSRVVILGTGLTMIDQALSLLAAGHRGEIVAVSRRGLLPRAHRPTRPLALTRGEMPFGARLSGWTHWLRRLACRAEAMGGSWRDAMDAVRPHIRAIWRSLPVEERARFLRHGASWWEVHRHRMPPQSEARIAEAIARGQMRIMRAGFVSASGQEGAVTLRLAPRNRGRESGAAVPETLTCGRLIDCRGIRRDPEANAAPVIADLLARGRARIDPLRIGIEVTQDCRVIDRDGQPSSRIRAIGPVSRATFWEMTAIPDIREQAAAVASDIVIPIGGA